MKKPLSGIYCWAGPGTVRMIRLKYPGHKINTKSILGSYDLDSLKEAKKKFGTTDAWVTYSWGFSPKTEQEDYEFIQKRLDNFHKLGIKVHAYIQGPNLVLEDHLDSDYWARDYWNRLIPYHRGRKLACPNNPYFQAYLQKKLASALKQSFDGVFIDNLFLGQFPLIFAKRQVSFLGCNCRYCLKAFKKETGFAIPKIFGVDTEDLKAYQDFRVKSLMAFASSLSDQVHKKGKVFGSNSLDPKYDTKLLYGTDLTYLQKIQDYLLFENHDLPRLAHNNGHLAELIEKSPVPVFVVSYKAGIGREKMYTQHDYDSAYSESLKLGYAPCYKASEFTDNRVWSNLDCSQLTPVKALPDLDLDAIAHDTLKSLKFSPLARMYNRWYLNFMEKYYENPVMRRSFNWLYYRAIS